MSEIVALVLMPGEVVVVVVTGEVAQSGDLKARSSVRCGPFQESAVMDVSVSVSAVAMELFDETLSSPWIGEVAGENGCVPGWVPSGSLSVSAEDEPPLPSGGWSAVAGGVAAVGVRVCALVVLVEVPVTSKGLGTAAFAGAMLGLLRGRR